MRTKEFLDKINGKIAEAFQPHLNKKIKFGNVHDIVAEAVIPLLPKNMRYTVWKIRPDGVDYFDITYFELVPGEFQEYKNIKYPRTGKFSTPPYYKAVNEGETMEELIRVETMKYWQDRLKISTEALAKKRKEIAQAEEWQKEIRQHIDLLSKTTY